MSMFHLQIETQIRDLGQSDEKKRDKLCRMINELKDTFPTDGEGPKKNNHGVVEELLNQDGTTVNVREDCDKRMTSLKEKECVILVSGNELCVVKFDFVCKFHFLCNV